MLLLALLQPAVAGTIDEAIRGAVSACAGANYPLPQLTADQRAKLAAGEVVKVVHRSEDPDGPSSAIGLALLQGGRDALWIAAQDPHTSVDPGLVEFVVEHKGPDTAVWYGHIDLPRPVTDRQWVVLSSNNHSLGEGCWEHNWKLIPDGISRVRPAVERGEHKVTLAQLEEAIYTPVNHGNWLMAPLPDGRTLVSYQATSVIGGSIPDWLVLQLTMSRLESVLRAVETRASGWAPSHYRANHDPVYGGNGQPITRFD
jgi:hypothetical protein